MNLKLLIVDDEKLDREGLARQINYKQFEIADVFLAKNGPSALEIVKDNAIDILLSDIKMPHMSGIELARRARQFNPDIKIIFISGHDDFEYAKSAIHINAQGYILKPVCTEELLSCVSDVVRCIRDEKKIQLEKNKLQRVASEGIPLLRQKLLLDIIYGVGNNYENRMNELNIRLDASRLAVLLLEIDDSQMITDEEELSNMNGVLLETVCSLVSAPYRCETIRIDNGRVAAIIDVFEKIQIGAMEEDLFALSQNILDLILPRFSITVGVGRVVNSFYDLNRSYNSSVQAVLSKLYNGNGKALRFEENDSRDETGEFQKTDYEIANCLVKLDLAKANYLIDSLFDSIEKIKKHDRQDIQYYCINIISRIEIVLRDFNVKSEDLFGKNVNLIERLLKFETIQEIRQWMKNIIRGAIEYLDARRKSKNSKLAEEILSYIKEKYAEDISLNEIAQSLFYTPNYLGNLFKNEVGRNFSGYLTEYRIHKAAELLRDTNIKISEVSLAVGYKDIPTFIKNFKAIFNVTPSEYRAGKIS